MDAQGCLLLYAAFYACSNAAVMLLLSSIRIWLMQRSLIRCIQASTATAYMCMSSANNAPAFNTSSLMVNHSCCMNTIAGEHSQDEMVMSAAPAELCRMVLTS